MLSDTPADGSAVFEPFDFFCFLLGNAGKGIQAQSALFRILQKIEKHPAIQKFHDPAADLLDKGLRIITLQQAGGRVREQFIPLQVPP